MTVTYSTYIMYLHEHTKLHISVPTCSLVDCSCMYASSGLL